MKGFIDEVGDRKTLSEGKMNLIFKKWYALSTLTIDNLIHDAKVIPRGGGYMSTISSSLRKAPSTTTFRTTSFLGKRAR